MLRVDKLAAYELSYEDTAFSVSGATIARLDNDRRDFGIIGQPRAIEALRMGLEMKGKGYNLFVSGRPGSGRRSAVMRMIEQHQADPSDLCDYAYVADFEGYRPKILYFAPGDAERFQSALRELLIWLRRQLLTLASSDHFRRRCDQLIVEHGRNERRLVAHFEQQLAAVNLKLVSYRKEQDFDWAIMPFYRGKERDFEQLRQLVATSKLSAAELQRIEERYLCYSRELDDLIMQLRALRIEGTNQIHDLRRELISAHLDRRISQLKQQFPDPRVSEHIARVSADLLKHLDRFLDYADKEAEMQQRMERYEVNIIHENTNVTRAPLINERHPSAQRLFGWQEHAPEQVEEMRPSFLSIRAGSLIRASGGFLILHLEDLIDQEEIWHSLKRTLDCGCVEIQAAPGPFQMQLGSLQPEPVEIKVTVIIIGNELMYDLIYGQDEDFRRLFKVVAEFDDVMEYNDQNIALYIGFIRMVAREEQALPLTEDGIARLVEHGVRLAEYRSRLSTHFAAIADLLRESSYRAQRLGKSAIDRQAVATAIAERRHLHNLPEQKMSEIICSGELRIATQGSARARINALALLERGYYAFARPILITASVSPGEADIVNIEREAQLSDSTHDKGVFILASYIQSRYARDFPLSIRASICFEQSYAEIDGDSASAPELYALLSAIGEFDLRQDIAVSGSVNQLGQIQPVGGINEKIEGFFEVCHERGLTGNQGVIIPSLNVANLLLAQEVQEALRDGQFHLYAIDRVDEGLKILSGHTAKELNTRIEKRLRSFADILKDYSGT